MDETEFRVLRSANCEMYQKRSQSSRRGRLRYKKKAAVAPLPRRLTNPDNVRRLRFRRLRRRVLTLRRTAMALHFGRGQGVEGGLLLRSEHGTHLGLRRLHDFAHFGAAVFLGERFIAAQGLALLR